jgi:drug/metabolite transporter (DMT)-like permease
MIELEDELEAKDGYVVGGRKKKNRHVQPTQKFEDEHEFVFDPKDDFRAILTNKQEPGFFGWVAGSWVILAFGAMLSFASANLLINEISPLGFDAIDYYNSGALVVCAINFARMRLQGKPKLTVRGTTASEGMLDIVVTEYRDLFYTRSGELDTRILVLIVMASFLTCAMFLSVSFTYALAGQIGLNIGLAQTVWGTTPFFGAILDFFLYNVRVPRFQIIGMLLMVVCVSLISFQHMIFDQEGIGLGIDGIVIPENEAESTLSVFVFAFTYCIIMALLVMIQKQASVRIKVNPTDFVTAYFFLTMIVASLYGAYSFFVIGREFNWHYFWIGSGASLLNLIG